MDVDRMLKALGLWVEMMRGVIDNDLPEHFWPEYNCVTTSLLFVRYARLCEPNNLFYVTFGTVRGETHCWITSGEDKWVVDPSLGQFAHMKHRGNSYGILTDIDAQMYGYEMKYYLSIDEEEAMLRGVVLTEVGDKNYRSLRTIGAQIALKSQFTRDLVNWTLED